MHLEGFGGVNVGLENVCINVIKSFRFNDFYKDLTFMEIKTNMRTSKITAFAFWRQAAVKE